MTRWAQRVFDNVPVVSKQEAKEKGLRRYFTGKSCSNGHIAPRYLVSGQCVVCSADKALDWEKRAYLFTADHMKSKAQQRRSLDPVGAMFRGVRSRAKKKGVEFTLEREDIVIPEKCPCCLVDMKMGSEGKHGPTSKSPSLDRLNPDRGYVVGNIAVICWRCNNLKRDATVEEMRTVLRWMESVMNPRNNIRVVG